MATQQKQVLLTTDLAGQIINYLRARPYAEVAELIEKIMRSPFAEVIKQPESEKKE